jgi:hypothetical protein
MAQAAVRLSCRWPGFDVRWIRMRIVAHDMTFSLITSVLPCLCHWNKARHSFTHLISIFQISKRNEEGSYRDRRGFKLLMNLRFENAKWKWHWIKLVSYNFRENTLTSAIIIEKVKVWNAIFWLVLGHMKTYGCCEKGFTFRTVHKKNGGLAQRISFVCVLLALLSCLSVSP